MTPDVFELIKTIVTYAPAVAVLMWVTYQQQQLIGRLVDECKKGAD